MKNWKNITRIAVKSLLWILLALVLLFASIYVPPFQKLVVGIALDAVNSSPDMEVNVESFKLRFPMTIKASGVEVYQKGDTMLLAEDADVRIGLLPIVKGEVDVKGIALKEVFLKMGHPDSSMWLRGSVGGLKLDPTVIDLSDRRVDLGNITLNRGRVEMIVNQDTTPPTPPTPVEWQVVANKLSLRDVEVDMKMSPSFESINGNVPELDVEGADLNLRENNVRIGLVKINGLKAGIFTPSVATSTAIDTLPKVENPYQSAPMAISIDRVEVAGDTVVYGVDGAVPQPGLDMNYLMLSEIGIELDSVYSCGSNLGVILQRVHAINTTSGVVLDVIGKVAMDSLGAKVDDMELATTFSKFGINAEVGLSGDTPSQMPVNAKVNGHLAPADLQKLFPDMKDMLAQLPQNRDIDVDVLVTGSMARIDVEKVRAEMQNHLLVNLNGVINNPTDADAIKGHLEIDGNIENPEFINNSLSPKGGRRFFKITPL